MIRFFKKIGIPASMLYGILFLFPTSMALNGTPSKISDTITTEETSSIPLRSIINFLMTIKDTTQAQDIPHENIQFLCQILEHDSGLVTKELIEAAFGEIANSLEMYKNSPTPEAHDLILNLEIYYRQLLSLCDTTTIITKAKKFTDLVVHDQLIAGELYVSGNATINHDLTVNRNEIIKKNLLVQGNEVIEGNLTVLGDTILSGSVTIPGPNISGSVNLIGTPQQACIIFKDAALSEKARICSSPVPGDKGVFISVDGGVTQNFRVNNEGGIVIAQPSSGAALTVTNGGEDITGTTNINTSGSAATSIGYGGLGPVNIGNSTGNIFLPTTLASSQFGDAFVVIDPTTGQVRLDVGGDTPGAIINGGQPGPLTIGTTNATSLALVTSGSNNARFIIDPAGNIEVTTGTFSVDAGGANITGNTNINTSGTGTTTIGNCPNTTNNIFGTTNINSTGICTTNIGTAGGATNMGNSASTNTIQGTTSNIGQTFMSASSGVVLTVTGNNANPATILVGNSSTTAPALKLINNPTGITTDFFLTIDSNGVVKQTSAPIETGFIINGGQPGPLTIGTTDATTMSFITNGIQRQLFDQNGAITINAPTAGAALTISGAAAAATPTTIINQNNNATTASALQLVGAATPTGAPLTITSVGANQNSITAGAGSVTQPSYSFTGNTNTGMYAPAINQLALVTSSTGRLIVDSTGSVSYFTKYRAHAYLNSNQTITAAANVASTIVFNSIASPGYDTNNNYNTATGEYTAPISGYYLVAVGIGIISTTAMSRNRSVNFAINGTPLSTGYDQLINLNRANVEFFLRETEIIQLNAGDILTAQFTSTANANQDTLQASHTHINIHFFSIV